MLLSWGEDTNPAIWTKAVGTNCLDLCELGLDVLYGVPSPTALTALNVKVLTRHEPADFFFAGLVPIVSTELRKLLESFHVKAQFLAVETSHRGKPYTKKQLYILNLLEVVDCSDYEKSRYKQTPEGVRKIRKVVLDESKAVGRHLFEVGPLPSPSPNPKAIHERFRCASEALARSVLESGLTGLVFTTIKDRDKLPPPAWKPNE